MAKKSRLRFPWPKKGGWFVQALESGTQYRARHEGLGRGRQLMLYRRPVGGKLEHVAAVAADDLESLERAAISDDARRAATNLGRCSSKVVQQKQNLEDSRAACDLVRDDLQRLGHMIPFQEREALGKDNPIVRRVFRNLGRTGKGR